MDALGIPPRLAPRGRLRKTPDFLTAFNEFVFLLDVAGGVLLGYLSGRAYLDFAHPGQAATSLLAPLLREAILGSLVAAMVLRESRLECDHELFAPRRLLARLFARGVAAMAILLAIGWATRGLGDMSRLWWSAWCGLFLLFAWLRSCAVVLHLHRLAMNGELREAVAVVGAPDVAARLAAQLAKDASVVRILSDGPADNGVSGLQDEVADLRDIARSGGVDTVVLALEPSGEAIDTSILQQLKSLPVQVAVWPESETLHKLPARRRMLSRVAVSVVADRPLGRWDVLTKAALDRVGAAALLTATAPLFLLVALAVALDSPGPVIFRQRRSGWCGRMFTIYKFRTMRHPAARDGFRQTIRNDPRLTRVGAWLRRTSLDELPQLWNVLLGDMSLVGPRPHAEMLHRTEPDNWMELGEYVHRNRVKPGLTGWAQIHGARGSITSDRALVRRIELDLWYIDHWSIWLDFWILLRTPWALLRGDNAY